MIRSFCVNLYHGKRMQGASTITQQLVRLLYFDTSKTFVRKIKEQYAALLVERQFSKEHIMQMYLNHVYFGAGIYGVEAACQRFWAKHVDDVTIDEAAVLAAVMRSPRHYSPLFAPLSSGRRRNVVLNNMCKLGFITEEQYQYARQKEVAIASPAQESCGAHIKEAIRIFLEDLVGKQALYTQGFVVRTTMDPKVQGVAERLFREQVAVVEKRLKRDLDGGMITLDVATGEIRALVGGASFAESQFNRALHARRQMGSIFKPLVYAAALEHGITFDHVEIDEPFEWHSGDTIWSPRNSTRTFEGPVTLARSLVFSNNIVTIKTFINVGSNAVIDCARRCCIAGPFISYPSLALGCVDATVKEAAGMFNVFANGGVYVEPHWIKWVKNQWGDVLFRKSVKKYRAIAARVSDQVSHVLGIGMQERKRRFPHESIQSEAIGKTGTTNDSRTCWFVGSTPEYCTALYLGCDDNSPMGPNVFPVRTVFPVWLRLYRAIDKQRREFQRDPRLSCVLIDSRSGERVSRIVPGETFSILV